MKKGNSWKINSMRFRLLLGSMIILVVTLAFYGAAVGNSIYDDILDAEFEAQEDLIYELFNVVDFSSDPSSDSIGISKDALDELSDSRIMSVNSTIYAYLQNSSTKRLLWGSPSITDEETQIILNLDIHPTGKPIRKIIAPLPEDKTIRSLSVVGLGIQSGDAQYQLLVTSKLNPLIKSDSTFQEVIEPFLPWLAISTAIILVLQVGMAHWIMRPIQHLTDEIKYIESGTQSNIKENYPTELSPLKTALNSLISFEKGQKQRYRDALDDLAHSLKNPLAAIRMQIRKIRPDNDGKETRKVLREQIERMDEIITHQLRRAVVSDANSMVVAPEKIRPLLFRLRNTLKKVHFDKGINFQFNVDASCACRIEADDLMELFGNLLDNACKHCDNLVTVTSTRNGNQITIDIDDDGMGFQMENPQDLLRRGIRADSRYEGQGIGMAVSTEIVNAIGGHIELMVSPQAGARVRLNLPV